MFAPTFFAQRLSTRIRRKLGHDPFDHAIAEDVVVISADETTLRAAAIALPGQLDKVRGTAPDTTLENELQRIQGGPILHNATLGFLLRNVQFFDGFLYCHGARRQQVVRPEPLRGHGPIERIATCSLPGTTVGDQFFGHFLIDDSATALLGARFAPPRLPRGTSRDSWSHAAAYRDQLGIQIPPLHLALIDRAWVFRDHGMTADRRARLHELRRRIRSLPGETQGHGVFIRRAGGQARTLTNEAEIEAVLQARGFLIVDPARQSVPEIIATLRDAAVVCSVEGSAFAHALLAMADGGVVLTIQPPWRFNNPWKDYTDALGMHYAFVLAEGAPTEFRVAPDDLLRTLDLAGV